MTGVKNILITGGSGFIGSNFLEYISDKKLNYKVASPTHKDLDILNLDKIKKNFDIFKPEVVINFVAYRDTTSAEKQRGDLKGFVWKTNVKGVENISNVCQRYGVFLIHISTDMIFSGLSDNPGPYNEDAKPEEKLENLSWYGWTKAEAERVLSDNKNVAIIRMGKPVAKTIYDPQLDYIGKILYLYDHELPLFDDQYMTLTSAPSVFEVVEKLIDNKKTGVFHVASRDVFTPYELGKYLINKVRGKIDAVKGRSIGEYLKKWPNRYPKYGGLLAKKTAEKLQVESLGWKEIVDLFLPFYE